MGIARSTFYDAPPTKVGDAEIVARIRAICDEFEAYGYRRVAAALRHQGLVVNGKKVRRLMREHALQPRRRRRYVVTTESDHDSPIFPNLAAGMTLDGPNQRRVCEDPISRVPPPHGRRAIGCWRSPDRRTIRGYLAMIEGKTVDHGGRIAVIPFDRSASHSPAPPADADRRDNHFASPRHRLRS